MKMLTRLRKTLCLGLAAIFTTYGFPTSSFAQAPATTQPQEGYAQNQAEIKANEERVSKTAETQPQRHDGDPMADFLSGGALSVFDEESEEEPRPRIVDTSVNVSASIESTRDEAAETSVEYLAALGNGAPTAALVRASYTESALKDLFAADQDGEKALVIFRDQSGVVRHAFFYGGEVAQDIYGGNRVMVSSEVSDYLKSEGNEILATVHSQPGSHMASAEDLQTAGSLDNFIIHDGDAFRFSKTDGTSLGSSFKDLAAFLNGLVTPVDSVDPAADAEARREIAHIFHSIVTRDDAQVLFAEIPVIDGTALGAVPSSVANLPSAFVYGNYITKQAADQGVKYVYDVKLASATEAVMKLENLSGRLSIGNEFTFWLKAEPNGDAVTYPVIVRARFTDKDGRIVEADLRVTNDKQAFTVDMASINASFDISNVQKIELVQSQVISGTNRRANIYLELGGLKDDSVDITGAAVSGNKPAVQGAPDFMVGGTAISPQAYTGGFSYVYDVRASMFNEAIATVTGGTGTYSIDSPFKIRLKAEDAPRQGETIPPLVYPVRTFVKFTDKDGRTVSVNLNLTGSFEDYLIDLAALNPQFDAANVKKMEMFHDGSFAASGGKNRRAKITADLDGLAKDVAVVTGSTITQPQPSTIGNQPVITRLGQYSSDQALTPDPDNAKTEGFSYQYDLRHNSTDQPVIRLSNPNGLMGATSTVTLWMRALKAVSGDAPDLTYPSRIMVRFTDENGRSAVALVDLTEDLKSFSFNLSALNAQLDPTKLASIDFVQDRSVSNNLRAKIDIKVNGLLKDSSAINGQPIPDGATPSTLGNNPTASVSGSFIKEVPFDGGVSYRYDVRHAPTHEAVMKIEKANGEMALTSANLILFMQAESIGASLQPPVKVLLRLTDKDGEVAATTLNITGTMQQFEINLLALNSSFDWSAVKKFELIQNNNLSGVNGLAKINVQVNGLGQKLGYSLNQNIPRNETTLVITDQLTNQVIRQEVYKGLYSTMESLVPTKKFREIHFVSQHEQIIHDIYNLDIYHTSKQTVLDPDTASERILTADPVTEQGAVIDGITQYSLRRVMNKGTENEFDLLSSPVSASGDLVGNTKHSRQKTVGLTTYVAQDVDSNGTDKPGITQFSKQTQELDMVYGDVRGDWIKIESNLTSSFTQGPKTAYSRQLNSVGIDVETQQVQRKILVISGYADSSFTTGDLSYSSQTVESETSHGGVVGDWIKVKTALNDTFGDTTNTTASRQLTNELTGVTKVIGNYKADFSGPKEGQALTYTEQTVEKGATHGGVTGDWTKTKSKLSSTFGEQAGVTQYALQMSEANGVTYVISDLTSEFDPAVAGAKFARQETETSTHGGVTGEWVKVASDLDQNFNPILAASRFSRQHTDEASKTTYILSGYTGIDFVDGNLEASTQKGLGENGFITYNKLSLADFSATARTQTSHSKDFFNANGDAGTDGRDDQITYDEICSEANVIAGSCTNKIQEVVTLAGDESIIYTTNRTDGVRKQTTWVKDIDGNGLADQRIYDAVCNYSQLSGGSCSPLIQEIYFFNGSENISYVFDSQGNKVQTLHTFNNAQGKLVQRTYDAVCSASQVNNGTCNPLVQELITLDNLNQLIKQFSAGTGSSPRTVHVMFDEATGDVIRQDVYDGLHDTLQSVLGVDLEHISLAYFIVEGAGQQGTLEINHKPLAGALSPSTVLSPMDIPRLPTGAIGDPVPAYAGASGSPAISYKADDRGLVMDYSAADGPYAGLGLSYNDFATGPVETADLSAQSQLIFGLKGNTSSVKLEIQDSTGASSSVTLSGINAFEENVFAVNKSLFSGLDWTKITYIFFVVENTTPAGTLEVNYAPADLHTAGLISKSSLGVNDITALPNGQIGAPHSAAANATGNAGTVQDTARGFRLNYSQADGSFSAGAFSYDDFGTSPAKETVDISMLDRLNFGIRGQASPVKFQIQDKNGNYDVIMLNGITESEKVWSIPIYELNPELDLSQIVDMFFIVENTNAIPAGFLEINRIAGSADLGVVLPSSDLTTADLTALPNNSLGAVGTTPLNPANASVVDTGRGFTLNYDTSADGYSGGGFKYDDFGTGAVESGDLSKFGQLVFGLKGTASEVKLEIIDDKGFRYQVTLSGISNTVEKVFSISTADLKGAKLLSSVVFLSPTEQLVIDRENNQTVYALFDGNGKALRNDVYSGIYTSADQLHESNLIQRIYFIDVNNQLIQSRGAGGALNQTTHVQINANGVVFKQTLYNQLFSAIEDADPSKKIVTTIFVGEFEQITQDHIAGETVHRLFDDVTELVTTETRYSGIHSTFEGLTPIQKTYFLSGSEQLILDYQSDPDGDGTPNPQTRRIVFNPVTFQTQQVDIYEGLPDPGSTDVSGLELLMTIIPLDSGRNFVKNFADDTTYIEYFDPATNAVLKREVYAGIHDDLTGLPMASAVFFLENLIFTKDFVEERTILQYLDPVDGRLRILEIYEPVKEEVDDLSLDGLTLIDRVVYP